MDIYKRWRKIVRKYDLDECFEIYWIKKRMGYVTDSNSDTVYYYKRKGRRTFRHTNKDSIDTEYRKEHLVMKKYPDKIYYYKQNKNGQIIKSTIFNKNKIKIGETFFDYRNGLPIKITSYDESLKMKYQEIYEYFYR